MIDLKGQNALVTGGSRGIGAAVCHLLAQAGANVAIAYHHNREAAETVQASVAAAGVKAVIVQGDLTNKEACAGVFKQAKDAFGSIQIVVGNAGVWKRAPIHEMTAEQWRETMSANLDSLYHTCQEAAIHMKPQKAGKIIIIASTAGQRGEANYSHYAASKGASIALTRSLATELGPDGINVNCVAPGWVKTDMTASVFSDPAYLEQQAQAIPLKRIAEPEDVAGPVVFLASELARHIQGAVINVNGGSVLC